MADERHAGGLTGGDLAPAPEVGAPAADAPGSDGEPTLPEALDPDLASWTADYPWVLPLVDPWIEALWYERRWRRRGVRAAGWCLIAGAIAGLAQLAQLDAAGEAMACWATFDAWAGPAAHGCVTAAPTNFGP